MNRLQYFFSTNTESEYIQTAAPPFNYTSVNNVQLSWGQKYAE